MSLSAKERSACLEDLGRYRVCAAELRREIIQADAAAAAYAARVLAAELANDYDGAKFYGAMSRRFYAAMHSAYEFRAVVLQQIRALERDLTK